jgi:hypothetical protein
MKLLSKIALFLAVPTLLLNLSASAGTIVAGKAMPTKAHTLVSEKGPIHAFAQDTDSIAWIGSGYLVHVRRLVGRRGSVIGDARQRGGPVKVNGRPLALAGTRALWTSYNGGNFLETHIYAGSPAQTNEIYELDNQPGSPAGAYLGGVAGDGATLVFGDIGSNCDNEYNCRRIDVSGAVKRVSTEVKDIPRIPPSFMLATSSNRIAVVPAKTPRFYPDIGPPRAAEYAPVEVYDLAGHLISTTVQMPGIPRAIALSWPRLAVLVEFVDGNRQIQLYDASTGGYWIAGGEGVFTRVPATVTQVAVGNLGAVYSVGSRIYLLRKQQPRLVWHASGSPIGLSIEGRRVAWAENVKGRGRIVALAIR